MIARPVLGSLPIVTSARGQPLAILLAVLALWVGLRISVWVLPFENSAVVGVAAGLEAATGPAETIGRDKSDSPFRAIEPWWTKSTDYVAFGREAREERDGSAAMASSLHLWFPAAAGPAQPGALISVPPLPFHGRAVAGTNALQAPVSASANTPLQPAEVLRARSPDGLANSDRISADAWLFVREGGGGRVGAGPLAPTYGASQFGAVLRYSLTTTSSHWPQVYLRATGAVQSREADLAGGASIQPFAKLPLRAHGELRLSRLGDQVEIRPAVFLTAGVDESLPMGARMRGYAQAGYVGGEFDTAFVDGSLVIERDTKRFTRGGLAIGAGLWGGAQEGTSRLDAGPTASLDLPLGRGRVRMAADYRFRVAGQAEPPSGAALTLSTSF